MNWSNLALWSAQIALLVGAAALAPLVFGLRNAHARLVYWQALLAVCLLLPLVQPWERTVMVVAPVAVGPAAADAAAVPPAPALPAAPEPGFGAGEAVVLAYAAGMLLRAAWFGLGLLRLGRHRRAARELDPVPAPVAQIQRELGLYPEIRLSNEVAGPVTFGFRNPVILFPARFPDLDPGVQAAVACHELLHVRRRDWLFTAMEEAVRTVFWFHPAVWWVLGQIQLAREQAVDRDVVRLMGGRERYIDALLALSGAKHQLDLAPAPLFLRRRHLTARVAAIIKEVEMSRRWLYSSVAACFTVLLMAGWLISGSLPLKAAPQYVADTPGVTVTAAAPFIHRSAVRYPAEAWASRIQGIVIVDAQLAGDGTVADASVVTGPMELRRAALESVLKWHFRREAGPRVQVSIEFRMPEGAGDAPPVPPAPPPVHLGILGVPAGCGAPSGAPVLLKLSIGGLSPEAAEGLRARLQVREGQALDDETMRNIQRTVREFDQHLAVGFVCVKPRTSIPPEQPSAEAGGMLVRIMPQAEIAAAMASQQAQPALPPAEGVQRIRVGANVQANRLVRSPEPVYPALARQARISGVVRIQALIAADGTVKNLSVLSGHPLLVPAAMDAVRQYEYAPTLLQGNPVEVVTQVDVNFTNPR